MLINGKLLNGNYMANLKFYKETVMPSALEPDSFYFIENGNYAESYVTNSTGTAKSVGNTTMISALTNIAINNALKSFNSLEIVPDIAARNALTLTRSALVLVIDASADATVNAGSALYAFNIVGAVFTKIAEYESMDVTMTWANIQGKPVSTPTQIDSAVSNSHTHTRTKLY